MFGRLLVVFLFPIKSIDLLDVLVMFSAVIACICISMPLANPHWLDTHIPPPLQFNWCSDVCCFYFFLPTNTYICCNTFFSCYCPHMQFYAFGQPSLTLDTHIPPPLQFYWCSDVCLFLPFFPIKYIDFFLRKVSAVIAWIPPRWPCG